MLDAISTAAKEYQLSKNKDWKELNLKEQLDQLKALQQQLSGNLMRKNPACCTKPNISTNKPIGLRAVSRRRLYRCGRTVQSCNTTRNKSQRLELKPSRYVGVDTATDDDFDYEERLNEIHIELEGLNEEAIAKTISENYKELAI